ncbi:MAG: P1 family peptidase [Leptolyngbyaceae cyanobacterium MO_188.B28]|nr:P1 family peptidase [Leptolyngbyaceae cyanobacterium MO_188.B28]
MFHGADTGTWVAGKTEPGAASLNTAGDWGDNTTLVIVAASAPLDRNQATILARMSSAGIARTLFPAFTPFDGDVVFAFSTGKGPSVSSNHLARLGELAASLVAQSIVQAVKHP